MIEAALGMPEEDVKDWIDETANRLDAYFQKNEFTEGQAVLREFLTEALTKAEEVRGLRVEIEVFAQLMEAALQDNKPRDDDYNQMFFRLVSDVGALGRLYFLDTKGIGVAGMAASIANTAMAIAQTHTEEDSDD